MGFNHQNSAKTRRDREDVDLSSVVTPLERAMFQNERRGLSRIERTISSQRSHRTRDDRYTDCSSVATVTEKSAISHSHAGETVASQERRNIFRQWLGRRWQRAGGKQQNNRETRDDGEVGLRSGDDQATLNTEAAVSSRPFSPVSSRRSPALSVVSHSSGPRASTRFSPAISPNSSQQNSTLEEQIMSVYEIPSHDVLSTYLLDDEREESNGDNLVLADASVSMEKGRWLNSLRCRRALDDDYNDYNFEDRDESIYEAADMPDRNDETDLERPTSFMSWLSRDFFGTDESHDAEDSSSSQEADWQTEFSSYQEFDMKSKSQAYEEHDQETDSTSKSSSLFDDVVERKRNWLKSIQCKPRNDYDDSNSVHTSPHYQNIRSNSSAESSTQHFSTALSTQSFGLHLPSYSDLQESKKKWVETTRPERRKGVLNQGTHLRYLKSTYNATPRTWMDRASGMDAPRAVIAPPGMLYNEQHLAKMKINSFQPAGRPRRRIIDYTDAYTLSSQTTEGSDDFGLISLSPR